MEPCHSGNEVKSKSEAGSTRLTGGSSGAEGVKNVEELVVLEDTDGMVDGERGPWLNFGGGALTSPHVQLWDPIRLRCSSMP